MEIKIDHPFEAGPEDPAAEERLADILEALQETS